MKQHNVWWSGRRTPMACTPFRWYAGENATITSTALIAQFDSALRITRRWSNQRWYDRGILFDTADVASQTAYAVKSWAAPVDQPYIVAIALNNATNGANYFQGFKASGDSPGDGSFALELLDAADAVVCSAVLRGEAAGSGGRMDLNGAGSQTTLAEIVVPAAFTYWIGETLWLALYVDPLRRIARLYAGHEKASGLISGWEDTSNHVYKQFGPLDHNWDDGAGGYNPPSDIGLPIPVINGAGPVAKIRLIATAATGTAAGYRRIGLVVSSIQAAPASRFVGLLGDSLGVRVADGYYAVGMPDNTCLLPLSRGGASYTTNGHQLPYWARTLGGVILWLGHNNSATDPPALKALMAADIAAAKALGGRVAIATLFHCQGGPSNAALEAHNVNIRSLAREQDIPLVDLRRLCQRTEDLQDGWRYPEIAGEYGPACYDVAGDLLAEDFRFCLTSGKWVETHTGAAAVSVSATQVVAGSYSLRVYAPTDAEQKYIEAALAYAAGQTLSVSCLVLLNEDGGDNMTTPGIIDLFRLMYAGGNTIAGVQMHKAAGPVYTIETLAGAAIATVYPGFVYRVEIARTAANVLQYRVGYGDFQILSGGSETHDLASIIVGKMLTTAVSPWSRGQMDFAGLRVASAIPIWSDAGGPNIHLAEDRGCIPAAAMIGAAAASLI